MQNNDAKIKLETLDEKDDGELSKEAKKPRSRHVSDGNLDEFRLWVGDLGPHTDDELLQRFFSQYGQVADAKVILVQLFDAIFCFYTGWAKICLTPPLTFDCSDQF